MKLCETLKVLIKTLIIEKNEGNFSCNFDNKKDATAWKVSKYEVISGLYFPVFGLNTLKYGPEITPYFEIFHAVCYITSNKNV